VVRTLGPASRTTAGTLSYVWNGRNAAGAVVANGTYTARSAAVVDLAGNAASNVRTTTVTVRT
jgi:flagellar hook assembly protein FlgD